MSAGAAGPRVDPGGRERGAWLAVALATLAMAICFAVWALLAPLAPLFRELYGLSATEAGLLVAVPVILLAVRA